MRFGLSTQWYDPEPGRAALPGALSRDPRTRGHGVQFVTGSPTHPSERLPDRYRMRRRADEVLDGVPVRRVAPYSSHDDFTVRRAFDQGEQAAAAVEDDTSRTTQQMDVAETRRLLLELPEVRALLTEAVPA